MNAFRPERFEERAPFLLAGLRRRHAYAEAEASLLAQWEAFEDRRDRLAPADATVYGVMCGHDAVGFEYLCAVEVPSFEGLPAELGRMRVPAQRYAVFRHEGSRSSLRLTWERILRWLDGGDLDSAHLPDFDRTLPNGSIEVWVGVVARQKTPTAAQPR